ncbi:MAG: DUF5655 domain-containing protein [Bacteroidota bacterium]
MNNKELNAFLTNKTPHAIELLNHFINEYNSIGALDIRITKSMIAFNRDRGIAYVIQIGKEFIDIVLPFNKPMEDNMCFRKIKQVPGTSQYNHHLRLYFRDDVNEEVKHYMELAYQNGDSSRYL